MTSNDYFQRVRYHRHFRRLFVRRLFLGNLEVFEFRQKRSNFRTRMYGRDAAEPGWRVCIGCVRLQQNYPKFPELLSP